jgi:hypothetical protein
MQFYLEFIVRRASGNIPADFELPLNLIAVILVQEEALVDLHLLYHAVLSIALYYYINSSNGGTNKRQKMEAIF